MNREQALARMVAPVQKRKTAWLKGIIQIHVTRACDLACSNCTQGSQFGGKASFITEENFEAAVISLKDYFGVVGIFGGNAALAPNFEALCLILEKHIPKNRRGLWCNNPRGHGKLMRRVFNPKVSNLNVHLVKDAYEEFKRDWPESEPFGLNHDSRHSPVYGSLEKLVPDESRRWDLIGNCAINQNWSAMICQFRGELRGYFCEIAGGQAMLNQENSEYPDTGLKIESGWWKKAMPEYGAQVDFHCHRCLVPLNGHGALAQADKKTQVTEEYSHLKLKSGGTFQIVESVSDILPEEKRIVTEYLGT